MVRPGPELLHDPRGQEGGRVDQPVPDRLRPGGVLARVTRVPLGGVLERLERRPLTRREVAGRRRIRPGQRRYQVDAGHVRPVLLAQQGADGSAPVAAGRPVPRVAQPRHQLRPRPGDPLHAPAGLAWLAAEPVAGQRRAHHVEGVTAVIRIGQWPDDLRELHHRTGPAMGQDQRQRVRPRRADVGEDDADPVDLGLELRQRVQPRLGRPPVVAVRPVPAQVPQVGQRHPLGPVGDGLGFRPARLEQPPPQVGQHGLGHLEQKRLDLGSHGSNPMHG